MAVNVGELELAIRAGGAAQTLRELALIDRAAAALGAKKIVVDASAAGRGLRAIGDEASRAMAGVNRLAGGNLDAITRRVSLLGEGLRSASTRAGSLEVLRRTEGALALALRSGNISLERRVALERQLKDTQNTIRGGSMLGRITSSPLGQGALGALGGLGIAAGISGVVSGITGTIGGAITATIAYNNSLRVLASTAAITGTPLAGLTRTSLGLQKSLGLSATAANTMTATAGRMAAQAGRAADTGKFLTSWLDLAKARGMSAADAMQALETTMMGQDEGLNRLGLANPSGIYKEWGAGADEASQKSAIMNEVMQEGAKVSGAFAAGMNTAEGAIERVRVAKEGFLVALGGAILGTNNLKGGTDGLIGLFDGMKEAVEDNRGAIGDFTKDLGDIVAGTADFIRWIGRLIDKLGDLRRALGMGPVDPNANIISRGLQMISARASETWAPKADFSDVTGSTASGVDFSDVTGAAMQVRPLTDKEKKKIADEAKKKARAAATLARGAVAQENRENAIVKRFDDASQGLGILGTPTLANTPTSRTLVQQLKAAGAPTAKLGTLPVSVIPKIPPPAITAFTAQLGRVRADLVDRFQTIGFEIGAVLTGSIGAAFEALGRGDSVGGALKALGSSLLSGIGSIMVSLGEQMVAASGLLALVIGAFESLNPVLLLAGGVALIALGSMMKGAGGRAVSSARGGGGGGASYGGGGGYDGQVNASARATLTPRAAPVGGRNAPTGRDSTLATPQAVTVNVNAIGWDSPRVQRDVATAVQGAVARGFKLGGAM